MAVVVRYGMRQALACQADFWRQLGSPAQGTVSLPVQAARNYTHNRQLLSLSPKADTHFTVPQKVEG